MAPHTSLWRQSSDCKIDLNLSLGPREVNAVVGKPQGTAKAEGLLSQTVVTEFPALNTLLVCLLILCTALAGEAEVSFLFVQFLAVNAGYDLTGFKIGICVVYNLIHAKID